ncbi:MAG: glycosyltransferase family 39 protein [candidate division Zixibacteria bacterium]|nr:glycosyltransferase family 39 protein [candidate division Zixibacteria bacterium]
METTPKRDRVILVVLALAILVRVIYLYQYHLSASWEQLTVDNWYHHHWAQSIAGGNILGDTTYFRAPLYVYCLGLLYAALGVSLWVGRLFGLAIGLASIGMTYLLARRFLSRWFAATAAIIQACLPIVIYFESELLLDPLFMLLMQVAVWRALLWLDTQRERDLFLTGLTFGLAAICRPTALVPAGVVLIYVLISKRASGSRLARSVLFIAGLLVFIAPITVRNLIVANDPVLIASQDGINLFIGNNEQADGLSAVMPEPLGHNWQIRQITYIAESDVGRRLKPGEVSAYWRGLAFDWIKDNPGKFLALFGKKLLYQFGAREISNNRSLQSHFSSFGLLEHNPLSFGLVFPLAVLGAIALWRRHPEARMVVLIVAVYAATVALFFFNSRFRLPVMPYYCLLAAAGLAWIWQQERQQLVLVATIIAAMFGLGWLSFHPPISYPDTWSVQSLVSRGLLLYSKSEFAEALGPFRQAADLRPDFPEVNLNLGATYLRMGKTDSAEAYFGQEIKLHPGRYKGYQNLASVCLLRGDSTAARKLAERALSLAPYDVMSNIVWLRALSTDSSFNTNDILTLVERAAHATDDDVEVLNESATVLVARGECEIAMRFLLRATAVGPPPIETDDQAFGPNFRHGRTDFERLKARTYYLLGYCHAQLGQVGEAIEYTRRAISGDSTLAEAYVNLYSGFLTQGRLLEADSVLSVAEKRFPNHGLIRSLTTPHH